MLVFPPNRIIISLDPAWPGGVLYPPFAKIISRSIYKIRNYYHTHIPLQVEGNYLRQAENDKYSCGVYCDRYFSQILTRYYETNGFKGFLKGEWQKYLKVPLSKQTINEYRIHMAATILHSDSSWMDWKLDGNGDDMNGNDLEKT